MNTPQHSSIVICEPENGYALLDSGDGEKLERYGSFLFRRPDPQALWHKNAPATWESAHAAFIRKDKDAEWKTDPSLPERWEISFGALNLWIRPTSFKHTGLFPEQKPNWDWMRELITASPRPITVLNLFGYTGGASLACAQAGASVVHVDGSKVAIGWGKDNAELSGLASKPIRWILDDARSFVKREIKRGNKYDGIILDPPSFGHGPSKELWKIEENLPVLLDMCRQILSDSPLFFLLNGYAAGYSAIAYENNLKEILGTKGGVFEKGELAIAEESTHRLLPAGIFARWHA